MAITTESFGKTGSEEVVNYNLVNSQGVQVTVSSFGAAITSIRAPDASNKFADVVLGYSNLAGYEENAPYLGVVVGRVGNRIAKGKFSLDGKEYSLYCNDGDNHLHGGKVGYSHRNWQSSIDSNKVIFSLHSPDGDEGYPGNLDITVTYELTEDNCLDIRYAATTDAKTVINLTNHTYFNLSGAGTGHILDHVLNAPNATHYTPVHEDLIPTGEVAEVKDTPVDFTAPHPIGERISAYPRGYDHNLVLNRDHAKSDNDLVLAARVEEPKTGRVLEVLTTEPAVQLYTGGFLDGLVGREGHPYEQYAGFCLETQHFPDSPNQPNFPSVVIDKDTPYSSETVFKFSTRS